MLVIKHSESLPSCPDANADSNSRYNGSHHCWFSTHDRVAWASTIFWQLLTQNSFIVWYIYAGGKNIIKYCKWHIKKWNPKLVSTRLELLRHLLVSPTSSFQPFAAALIHSLQWELHPSDALSYPSSFSEVMDSLKRSFSPFHLLQCFMNPFLLVLFHCFCFLSGHSWWVQSLSTPICWNT